MSTPNPLKSKNPGTTGSRRERFQHRRKGSGRQTRTAKFSLQGRRSDFKVKPNIKRGEDGFEDLDDFWGETPNEKKTQKVTKSNKGESSGKVSDLSVKKREEKKPSAKTKSPKSPNEQSKKSSPKKEPTRSSMKKSTRRSGTPVKVHQNKIKEAISSIKQRKLTFDDDDVGTNKDTTDIIRNLDDTYDDYDDAPAMIPEDEDDYEEKETEMEASKSPAKVTITEETKSDHEEEEDANGSDDESFQGDNEMHYSSDDQSDTPDSPVVEPKKRGRGRPRKSVTPKTTKPKKLTYVTYDSEEENSATPDITNTEKKRMARRGRKLKRIIPPAVEPGETTATPNVRRSKRRRWKPLQHWKGERLLMQRSGVVEEIAEVVAAERPELFISPEQPKYIRRRPKQTRSGNSKRKKVAKIEPPKLDFEPHDPTEPVECFDVFSGEMEEKIIVRKSEDLSFRQLPMGKDSDRPAPLAAASFDDTQLVSGIMEIPANGSKPEERTFRCTQVFFIIEGQEESIEVNVVDRKYILSPGDHFLVPAHTTYSVTNHSQVIPAKVSFTLVKPYSKHREPGTPFSGTTGTPGTEKSVDTPGISDAE